MTGSTARKNVQDKTPGRTSEEFAGHRASRGARGVGHRTLVQREGCQLGVRGAVRTRRDGPAGLRVLGEATVVGGLERRPAEVPNAACATRVQLREPVPTVTESGFDIEAAV